MELDEDSRNIVTCEFLEKGKIIAWFQGKMEFGPRALGHRSILGDARIIDMQKRMNLKVKFRESFRPFAPVVLEEDASEYFEFEEESPYMLFVAPVKKKWRSKDGADEEKFGVERINQVRSKFPAITHVDYSARLQTVSRERNPTLYSLLKKFKERNAVSVLINTSLNIRGEPIVCSPREAYNCFMKTDIDVLVLGNCIISKEDLNLPILFEENKGSYELD